MTPGSLVLLLGLAALIQVRGAPLNGGLAEGSASLPLERASGGDTPVLGFRTAQGPVRLLLDTGASATMVTPELVARLGLTSRPLPPQDFGLAAGGQGCAALRPRRVRLPRLQLLTPSGALRLREIDGLVLPVAALPPGVDGVLGAPTLRQLPIAIDPLAGLVGLGDAALHQRRPPGPPPLVLPLRWRHGVPLLSLRSPRGPVAALADTGAEGLFISPQLAARLTPLGPDQPLQLAGFCGLQPVRRLPLRGLALGPSRGPGPGDGLQQPLEGIVTETPVFGHLGVEAIVGQELLRQRPQRWRLDLPQPRLELW